MKQRGPYSLLVAFQFDPSIWREIANGHCPQEVRAAHDRVARNPAVIHRIELHDLTGPLETIWAADWEHKL